MALIPASAFILFLLIFDSNMAKIFASNATTVMNDKGDTWGIDDTSVDDLPIPLGMHTSTQLTRDGKSMIYIIGGCTGIFRYRNIQHSISDGIAKKWPWKCTDFSRKVFAFNPYTDSYHVLADMPIGKYGHTAVEVDGKIWVIGGRSTQVVDHPQFEDKTISMDMVDQQIDIYDIAADSWDTIKKFEKATASGASFSLESGSLYYAGGFDDAYIATDEVVKIDTRKYISDGLFEFEPVASLKVARGMIHATTVNRVGFIAGGSSEGNYCEALKSAEEYNPYAQIRGSDFKGTDVGYNDVWNLVIDEIVIDKDVHPSALINLNDQILAFSGVANKECLQDDENISLSEVTALDWENASSDWYFHGNIPESRFYFSAIPLPERNAALIFGGTTFYEQECNCMKTMTRVSAYYIIDELTTKQSRQMSGGAKFGLSLFFGAIVIIVIYQIYFRKDSKSTETVINQEGVSSLPGAEGKVEDVNKDLGLVKNGKENGKDFV